MISLVFVKLVLKIKLINVIRVLNNIVIKFVMKVIFIFFKGIFNFFSKLLIFVVLVLLIVWFRDVKLMVILVKVFNNLKDISRFGKIL